MTKDVLKKHFIKFTDNKGRSIFIPSEWTMEDLVRNGFSRPQLKPKDTPVPNNVFVNNP